MQLQTAAISVFSLLSRLLKYKVKSSLLIILLAFQASFTHAYRRNILHSHQHFFATFIDCLYPQGHNISVVVFLAGFHPLEWGFLSLLTNEHVGRWIRGYLLSGSVTEFEDSEHFSTFLESAIVSERTGGTVPPLSAHGKYLFKCGHTALMMAHMRRNGVAQQYYGI